MSLADGFAQRRRLPHLSHVVYDMNEERHEKRSN
jgi:hypothetical protein